ncbi:MAG: AAA family ATPase [Planctomycetes bacterium]|nr:AAA family ATPase [Planctomycetota bacterium]
MVIGKRVGFRNLPGCKSFRNLDMEAQRGKIKPRIHARRVLAEIKSLLEGFFDLGPNDAIELLPTAIALRRGRDSVRLAALGDGYRSIVTIVLDRVAWWFLKQPREDRTAGMSGIVLIDEVEQHLHPNWQRTIMYRLARTFPNHQIVISSTTRRIIRGQVNCAKESSTPGLRPYAGPESSKVRVLWQTPAGQPGFPTPTLSGQRC